jgi:hypothetical protein
LSFSKDKFKSKWKGIKSFRLSKLKYNWNENFHKRRNENFSSKHNWNTIEIESEKSEIEIQILKAKWILSNNVT